MSNVEKQRRFRQRMVEAGFVQLNLWVPAASAAELHLAAELMRENAELRVARLVDTRTGRLTGLRKKGRAAPAGGPPAA